MKYTVKKTGAFDKWLKSVKDPIAKRQIGLRILKAENGNLGDVKALGKGISEMRLFVGKGYRLYFTIRDQQIILLLNGGTKGTQQADIDAARELLKRIGG